MQRQDAASRSDFNKSSVGETTSVSIWTELLGAEVAQRYYDVKGVRTRVLEAGQGPPLILVHGTGGYAEAYTRNIVEHAKHFHVYAIDMVGHGFTDAPDLPYTMDDFVAHLGDFIDTIGADKVMLSGESLGAMVSAWYAIRNPQRVARLVLNTGMLISRDEKGKAQLQDVVDRSKRAAGNLTMETVRTRMEWLMANPEKTLTDEMVEVRYRIYAQPGRAAVMGKIAGSIIGGILNDEWAKRYSDAAHMRGIKCPTLVLWTTHNPGLTAERAAIGAREIPDHRMVVLDDCAHWPQSEQAEQFNRIHIDFLRG
jgi:2-hydroxy-6-oxonona-2,4-dienedioate hydrolase